MPCSVEPKQPDGGQHNGEDIKETKYLAEQAMTLLSGYDASVNAPDIFANYCVSSTTRTDLTPSLTLDRGIP